MTEPIEHYESVLESFDHESTLLVVRGANPAEVAAALHIDLGAPLERGWTGEVETVAWAMLPLSGGVLAWESTGFGDPTRGALVRLSAPDRAAAVVRDNVLAHVRFGVARDGELLFDDNEYMFIEDPSVVPADLRPLFDLGWINLDLEDAEGPSGYVVGLAMAEHVTGLRITSDDLRAIQQGPFFRAPGQVYAASLDD